MFLKAPGVQQQRKRQPQRKLLVTMETIPQAALGKTLPPLGCLLGLTPQRDPTQGGGPRSASQVWTWTGWGTAVERHTDQTGCQ